MSRQWNGRRKRPWVLTIHETLEPRTVLSGSPVVTDVSVGSSEWSAEFSEHLSEHGFGEGGYSVATGARDQEATVPWTNLNQIRITFDADVAVNSSDLVVSGVENDYAIEHFEYSSETRTATWQLADALVSDQIRIQLATDGHQSIRSLDGAVSDETAPVLAGDQSVGGSLAYTLNVVAGDVDGDASTTRVDYVNVNQAIGSEVGDSTYDPMRDVDGSGQIDLNDLRETMSRNGLELPLHSPISSGSAPSITLSCGSVGANLWWFTGTVTDPDGPAVGWQVDLEGIIRTYVDTDTWGNYEHYEYLGTTHGGTVTAYTEDPQGNQSNIASCYAG